MINLSDFNKSIKYNLETGEKEKIFEENDFEFFALNKKRFKTINEGIQKIGENSDDLLVVYTLLPYICSINVDISLEEFYEMNEISPRSEFTDFMLTLTSYMKDLLGQIDKIKKMQKTVDDMTEQYPILKKQETLEEKIERLNKELVEEKDTKKKRGILLELAKAYEEAENNG